MDHKERTREKEDLTLGVNSMKESSEKAIKVNIELRLNFDEQQDAETFKLNQT